MAKRHGSSTIKRAALGRPAFIGELYDVKDDTLQNVSLFLDSSKCGKFISVLKLDNTVSSFSFRDKFSERLDGLHIPLDQKLGLLFGVHQKLSINYDELIRWKKNTNRILIGTLIHTIYTTREELDTNRGLDKANLIKYPNYILLHKSTHVVSEISHGHQIILTFQCKMFSSSDYENYENQLESLMNELRINLTNPDTLREIFLRYNHLELSVEVYGSLRRTFENWVHFSKEFPEWLKGLKESDGNPVEIGLYPTDGLTAFNIKTFKSIGKDDFQKYEDHFQGINDAKCAYLDYYEDVKNNPESITRPKDICEVSNFFLEFQSKFNKQMSYIHSKIIFNRSIGFDTGHICFEQYLVTKSIIMIRLSKYGNSVEAHRLISEMKSRGCKMIREEADLNEIVNRLYKCFVLHYHPKRKGLFESSEWKENYKFFLKIMNIFKGLPNRELETQFYIMEHEDPGVFKRGLMFFWPSKYVCVSHYLLGNLESNNCLEAADKIFLGNVADSLESKLRQLPETAMINVAATNKSEEYDSCANQAVSSQYSYNDARCPESKIPNEEVSSISLHYQSTTGSEEKDTKIRDTDYSYQAWGDGSSPTSRNESETVTLDPEFGNMKISIEDHKHNCMVFGGATNRPSKAVPSLGCPTWTTKSIESCSNESSETTSPQLKGNWVSFDDNDLQTNTCQADPQLHCHEDAEKQLQAGFIINQTKQNLTCGGIGRGIKKKMGGTAHNVRSGGIGRGKFKVPTKIDESSKKQLEKNIKTSRGDDVSSTEETLGVRKDNNNHMAMCTVFSMEKSVGKLENSNEIQKPVKNNDSTCHGNDATSIFSQTKQLEGDSGVNSNESQKIANHNESRNHENTDNSSVSAMGKKDEISIETRKPGNKNECTRNGKCKSRGKNKSKVNQPNNTRSPSEKPVQVEAKDKLNKQSMTQTQDQDKFEKLNFLQEIFQEPEVVQMPEGSALDLHNEIDVTCYAKCRNDWENNDSLSKEEIQLFPVLRMMCPSSLYGNCKLRQMHEWLCYNCSTHLLYGLDTFIYCINCGKAPATSFSFKCSHLTHGETFFKFSKQTDLLGILEKLGNREELNILILGETGVGKTTFINAFANYLTYETLDEAKSSELIGLIPSTFTLSDENYEEITVKFGQTDVNESEEEGASKTQTCKCYSFPCGDKMVKLIDTPGIGDTKGIDQDAKNFVNILSFISNFSNIHGILLLLKPNNSRLNIFFRFCIQELLKHLHKSASENINFVFTNSKSTFYRPGDTFPPLKKLIGELKDITIPLNQNTIYCLDNDSFRYLVASHNKVKFNDADLKEYTTSWVKSARECERLLRRISQLKPHSVKDTLSINGARRLIVSLAQPLGDIIMVIHENLYYLNEQLKTLSASKNHLDKLNKCLFVPTVESKFKFFANPRTICKSNRCTQIMVNGKEDSPICHDPCSLSGITPDIVNNEQLKRCATINDHTGCCVKCHCSWRDHMHVQYEIEKVYTKKKDSTTASGIEDWRMRKEKAEEMKFLLEERRKEFLLELDYITKASAIFSYFLMKNSLTNQSDFIKNYLQALIEQEKTKQVLKGRANADSSALIVELQNAISGYSKELDCLNQESREVTAQEIEVHVNMLYSLPKFGDNFRIIAEKYEESLVREVALYSESVYVPKSKSVSGRFQFGLDSSKQ